MKRFLTIALVALVALAALAVPVSAADSVVIRSTIMNNASGDFEGIFIDEAGDIEFSATNFAGFWADLDDDLSSETLTIVNDTTLVPYSGNAILENGLIYNATIVQANYTADFDDEMGVAGTGSLSFPLIGLFAEPYVSVSDTDAGELVKLLMDSDDKYTLRTGSALELPNGYALTAKQIDVEGNKVWMELTKDGEFVEDEVIAVTAGSDSTWDYDVDVGDQDDVVVFRALITDVFQGQVDSLAVVEGLWLVDYENVMEIETSDEFGELEVDSIDTSIVMKNTGTLTLSADKTVDIAEDMFFMTADSTDLRFFVAKEYTAPGTYTVRGNIAITNDEWNAYSFAAFWADLDDNLGSEVLTVTEVVTNANRGIPEDGLTYNATIVQANYTADFDDEMGVAGTDSLSFPLIGLFAEPYVSVSDTDAGELVKLLMDSDDKYTLRTGSALELPNGYALTAKQIDVEGNKVWMELSKDGEFVEDEVIDVSTPPQTWDYDVDVGDQDDVIVFRALITDVFQGQVDSLAVVEGLWLVDYENVMEIETSDEFGELEVVSIDSSIVMNNTGTITLGVGDTVDIAEGMKFLVADDNANLRYFPFVERTIGEDTVGEVTEGEETEEEMPVEEEAEEEVAEEEAAEEEVAEEEVAEEEAEEEEEEPVEESPGFESIFAVAGLLAVAYLVRRN